MNNLRTPKRSLRLIFKRKRCASRPSIESMGEVFQTGRTTNSGARLDNTTQQKLFTVRPFNDNLFDQDESRDCGVFNPFYDGLKPFIFVMRSMGILPVRVAASGTVEFSWISIVMLYSMCVYALLCSAVWFTQEDRLEILEEANGHFEDSVDAYLLMVYLMPLLYLPFTHWGEAARTTRCFNSWLHFKKHYQRVTGKTLVVPLKCRCLAIVLITLALSLGSILVSFHNITHDHGITGIFLYTYLVTLRNIIGLYWYYVCTILCFTAVTIENNLFKQHNDTVDEGKLLAQYRLLWLDLSTLVTQTGAANCYTYGFYMLHQFFMVTLSTFATLSDVMDGSFGHNLLVINSFIFSSSMIFAVCEGSNDVILKVEVAFQRKLLRLKATSENKSTQREVNMFLRTIATEPPVMSLGGYVRINRELLVSFGSTLVTYLIVLLQLSFTVATTSQQPSCSAAANSTEKTFSTAP